MLIMNAGTGAVSNTPKAFAIPSPGLERQRQPWVCHPNIKLKPCKGSPIV